jgi:dienelactone hydrolase
MHPSKVSRRRLGSLTDLPNVGPSIAKDLQLLGIRKPSDLVGKSPVDLYEALNHRTGTRHDPCVLDTFVSVTSFMNGGPARVWWAFTPARKRLMARGLAVLILSCLAATTRLESQAQPTPAATRAAFLQVIDRPKVPLTPTAPIASTENGFLQERLTISTEQNETVPLLLLKKQPASGRQPAVIVLHGTGGSKESVRAWLERVAGDGFIGVAMDARHHGERAHAIPGLPDAYQSAMLRAYRTGETHPYLYDTVWDVLRLVDYLATRLDIDTARIGLVGISKGGTEAYLAAAADERIAVTIPLIGVQSYGWSLRRPSAWEARTWTLKSATEAAAALDGANVNAAFVRKFYDRIAPGLVDRFDGPAMLPLIAPRALLVVNGDSDPRSPLAGVREAVSAAERAYTSARARDRFSFLLEVDAAHEVTPEATEAARQWLIRWLTRAGG